VNSVAASNIVSPGLNTSSQSIKNVDSETGMKLIAGPGLPTPLLPLKSGGGSVTINLLS